MKGIMFNEHIGLESAVLDGTKTMTRRICPDEIERGGFTFRIEDNFCLAFLIAPYKIGEIVAIKQSYKTIVETLAKKGYDTAKWMDEHHITKDMAGWLNKMFVKADLMIFKIQITNIRLERLQDISDEDCMKEGIVKQKVLSEKTYFLYAYNASPDGSSGYFSSCWFKTPREAFAALIDKTSGKGTWNSNPYVFVYEFKLID